MNKLPTIIIILISLPMLASCGFFLPWQMSTALTAGDIILSEKTGKSSSEHLVSNLVNKDCQWVRVLDGEDVCMSKKSYEEYLLKMNCFQYEWNILGLPSCKDGKTNKKEKYGPGPW